MKTQAVPGVILRMKVQSLGANDGDSVNQDWDYLRCAEFKSGFGLFVPHSSVPPQNTFVLNIIIINYIKSYQIKYTSKEIARTNQTSKIKKYLEI